jgi:hypothetical protein
MVLMELQKKRTYLLPTNGPDFLPAGFPGGLPDWFVGALPLRFPDLFLRVLPNSLPPRLPDQLLFPLAVWLVVVRYVVPSVVVVVTGGSVLSKLPAFNPLLLDK